MSIHDETGTAGGATRFNKSTTLDDLDNSQKVSFPQEKKAESLCVLGIDPGISGAVAFYFPAVPDRVVAEDMPVAGGAVDCATLAARIVQMAPDLAIVERVGSMPGQGVSSTFKFGAAYGALHGILGALQIRTVLVTPQVWKKHFRLDSDKEKSRALALRTFAKTPEHFARKRDDGRAEAALLAVYGDFLERGESL
jgi:crossover junction endodeoxyribonuclease RuvC